MLMSRSNTFNGFLVWDANNMFTKHLSPAKNGASYQNDENSWFVTGSVSTIKYDLYLIRITFKACKKLNMLSESVL